MVTNPIAKNRAEFHRCEQDLLKRIDGVAGSLKIFRSSSLWSLKLFSKIQDTQAV